MTMRALTLILVIVAMTGCKREPEPTYQGRAMSEWVKLSDDRDGSTQVAALEALANFKANADAKSAIGRHLKDPTPGVRLAACISWFSVANDKSPVMSFLREQIARGNADKNERFYAAHIAARIAVVIGTDGKAELLPHIRAIENWNDSSTESDTGMARAAIGEPLPRKPGFIGLE